MDKTNNNFDSLYIVLSVIKRWWSETFCNWHLKKNHSCFSLSQGNKIITQFILGPQRSGQYAYVRQIFLQFCCLCKSYGFSSPIVIWNAFFALWWLLHFSQVLKLLKLHHHFLSIQKTRLVHILFRKLFWHTLRKNCSSDREVFFWYH